MVVGEDELRLLGVEGKKAEEVLRNKAFVANLKAVVNDAIQIHCPNGKSYSAPVSTLLYQLATRAKAQYMHHVSLIVKHIVSGGITKDVQLAAALEYAMDNAKEVREYSVQVMQQFTQPHLDETAFKKKCGVGVTVSADDIEAAVTNTMEKFEEELVRDRYSVNFSKLMNDVIAQQPWADRAAVKKEIELQQMLKLGPRTAEELTSKTKGAKAASADKSKDKPKASEKAEEKPVESGAVNGAEMTEGANTIDELVKTKVKFHKPGENYKTDGYVMTPNTHKLLEAHLTATGGKVITRFPPEPNGILHIGHAKAININFGYAKAMGGECNLRYDDTNPEKEEERFFTGIRDMIEWLGYKPTRITHASDNFEQLYAWAVQLIKSGNAYVCHQRQEDIKGFNPPPSPWRNRPIEESLQLFEDMRMGRFDEGEATLRMKTTLEDGKQDPVAYRIKYAPHHRTGDKWCIYPTYDYTHCLCDSIENITHSLCTKEFQARRSSYYWLCNALDIYCPVQWEYGRLNFYYTVVSKRKIDKLIKSGMVRDWDDPRLFTLTALRRRGIPAEAINTFVAKLGVTMTESIIDPAMLDAVVRDKLNYSAPRCMAVLQPILLHIINWGAANMPSTVEMPDFPAEPNHGTHTVPLTKKIYIDADDFRETDVKGFKRFTPNQPVGLVSASAVVTFVRVLKREDNRVMEIEASIAPLSTDNKPKGFIQWVCEGMPCEVRLYERLFLHKNPEEQPGGFISDVNPNSLRVMNNALVDTSAARARVYDTFQFQRLGYFTVDSDSTIDKLVFNRTVGLREDAGKNV